MRIGKLKTNEIIIFLAYMLNVYQECYSGSKLRITHQIDWWVNIAKCKYDDKITNKLNKLLATFWAVAMTGGGSELENKYGRDLWRSSWMSSLGPAV